MRLVLGAPLSSADMAWLQAAFAGAGLLERCASFELVCAEAALSSTFRQVRRLHTGSANAQHPAASMGFAFLRETRVAPAAVLRGAKHWMLMPIVSWCPGFVLGICNLAKPNIYAVLQVDVLKLTVERLGSASKGLCSGAYRNVESLSVTHVTREDDVQVRWASIRAGLPAGRGCPGLL